MAWRKPKDPLLTTPLYRRNRAHLKRLRLPCAVCGRTIDYSEPGAFVAGHIVSRYKAKLYGWTEPMINALSISNRSVGGVRIRRGQGRVIRRSVPCVEGAGQAAISLATLIGGDDAKPRLSYEASRRPRQFRSSEST